MRICILAPYRVIPIMGGASRRVFEMASALAQANVDVVLIHAGSSRRLSRNLQIIGFRSLENLIARDTAAARPFALDTYLSSANPWLASALVKYLMSKNTDILQVEGPWSSFPVAAVLPSLPGNLRLIYDFHNVESETVRQAGSFPLAWPWVLFLEREAVRRADLVFCVSEKDRDSISRLHNISQAKVTVVPNGVSKEAFGMPGVGGDGLRRKLGLPPKSKLVFFHGALGWKPNSDAALAIARSIAPEFNDDVPGTFFLIAGPNPSRRLLKEAERMRNVSVLGYVANIQEYISCSDVCIAPLVGGGGTRLKMLEYLAAGKPIVATFKAAEGLALRDHSECLLFDNLGEGFANGIREALSPEVSARLGSSGRVFAERFEWSAIVRSIIPIYDSLLQRS